VSTMTRTKLNCVVGVARARLGRKVGQTFQVCPASRASKARAYAGLRYLAAPVLVIGLLFGVPAASHAENSEKGVLILAHGGNAQWNQTVLDLARRVDRHAPAEVAFGMASRQAIQEAVDRLTSRGVREITAVPLFISSHSSVITATEYLLGHRDQAPPELAAFARMRHGHGSHGGENGGGHGGHGEGSTDGTTPVKTTATLRMVKALDDHPLVGDILAARARSISTEPASEVVVIVAHGPVSDDDNARWLASMRGLADRVKAAMPFAGVEYLTVRDDAPAAIKQTATEELRTAVRRAVANSKRVLIVPLLLSFGGIEQGIRKRLEGLDYAMAPQGLMPDDRVFEWVMGSAGVSR
jgi:sirohydrochlorin ferrochelatase